MDRFTRFPNIYTKAKPDVSSRTEIEWRLDGIAIPLEVLVLSWASLLFAFTGEESPVFALNQEPVKADLSSERFDAARLNPSAAKADGYTAIVTHDFQNASSQSAREPDPGQCILSIELDLHTGAGSMQSDSRIEPASLDQIGRQLKQFIQKHALAGGLPLRISPTDAPQLSIANPDPRMLPGPQLLHQLVVGRHYRSNNAIEFLLQDETVHCLSYEDLDQLSTAMAAKITRALARPSHLGPTSTIVPVLLPQSVDLYVSWLAILKVGAAFCPLGTDSPEDRVQFIIKDVSAKVVVTQSGLREKIGATNSVTVVLTDDTTVKETSTVPDAAPVSPKNLAYVMYTSGSTGRPKGVGISHYAATQSLLAHDKLIPSFKRFLQFASPTFDVSVFEVFFPLFRGATLVGSERSTMLRDLPHVITRMQVDAAELTPTVAGELLRSRHAAPGLKVLLTIGEMLTKQVVDEFGSSASTEGILHAMYGPTEAAIHCTAAPSFSSDSRINLIGQPFETVSAFVVSLENDQESHDSDPVILPIGQIGELVVGGIQLADGYINRPVENSKAFLKNKRYGRLYRTGDKARLLPAGNIECLGRISSGQVKLRGQRVELGEIEKVVCMVEDVRSAIAIVVRGILVVWALVDNSDITSTTLRQTCQKRLPMYMVPGDFVLVHEFPRLASGKVDRRTLESDYVRSGTMQHETERVYRNALEQEIALNVSQTLHTPAAHLKSLAAAGLDSLSGIQLAHRLRTIGVNLDVGRLLAADSVEGIWRLAEDAIDDETRNPLHLTYKNDWKRVVETGLCILQSIGLGSEIENVEPCSHMQTAMLSESFRDSKTYCNWVELKFDEKLEVGLVKEAFHRVTQHNDILRSGFMNIGLSNNPFCRFTWKTLGPERIKETASLDYDWTFSGDDSILIPLTVQLQKGEEGVRALVQMHHALYDGWSWDFILDDLHAALSKEALMPRSQYADIVKYYMEYNHSDFAAQSASYWRDHLQNVVPLKWSSFHDKTDVPRGTGTVGRLLDLSLLDLDKVSRSLSVSRQSIFQAAFAFLLSFYLETSDVVFGTVFSGRTLPVDGIESIIGPCLQVLPTRLNLDWVRTVSDLLRAVHQGNRRALEYGKLPLKDIKKLSEINATESLFSSLLVWQETPWTAQSHRRVFKEVASADFLEFAMTIQLEPRNSRIYATATFEESVFPTAQVQIFLEQIDAVTAQFIQTPELLIHRVNDCLPFSVLSIENPKFEQQLNLPSLAYGVEKLALADPNRNAIEFIHTLDPSSGDSQVKSITYDELNRRANRLARYLIDLSVASGDIVAIILDKSLDLYISMLAVIKIGAGYVPLTPQTPIDRLHFVLTEARPRLCIINSVLRLSMHSLDGLHFVESDIINIDEYPDTNVLSLHNGANLAYTVFTSGSTGKPKGVLITHRNLQSNIAVLTEIYPVGDKAKMLQACSQAFDVSVFEIFFAWSTGMTLCSATNDIMFRDIEQVIRNSEVTHLSLTPTVAALVHPKNVPAVRFLVTAGEGLTAKVHKDWAGHGLYQGYGPSETTNICTIRPDLGPTDSIRNIGKPFKNTSTFVISNHSEFSLMPRGGTGEFCFGGDQVGQGYLNLPDLTNQKFIDHPHYGRLYRSGDFGRLLSNGSLMFTGRRDDQVKLRGQRIELGEINSTLLRNATVKDCATIIIKKPGHGQQQLVTFWVSAYPPQYENMRDLASALENLFRDLFEALPTYMIPSYLIPVDSIPMTVVRKIDHRALERIFLNLGLDDLKQFFHSQKPYEANDFSETEFEIAKIVSEVTDTRLENIRTNTPLYNLGIDSISAIHLSKRLRHAGFGQLDVSVILRHGSVAQLNTVIARRDAQSAIRSGADMKPIFDKEYIEDVNSEFLRVGNPIQSIIPCTALQEAMLSRTPSKDETAYCNHLTFEVFGNVETLRQIWEDVVARHDIFRTCFRATANPGFIYAQVILKRVSLPWTYLETPVDDMPFVVERLKCSFIDRVKDPHTVPYAITVLEDKIKNKTLLLFSIHHALHDGEAMSRLLKEIEQCYMGGQPPKPIQFHQFIDFMVATNEENSEQFWRQYLSGLSPLLLCPRPKRMDIDEVQRGGKYTIDLGVSRDLFGTMCRKLSATPLNIFHAAWTRLLAIYTDSSDICFGNVFSCRTIPLDGVERIIGPCFNTLPIRIKMSPTAMNTDIVKLTQQVNVDIMPHQLFSLRQIQKSVSESSSPIFDTLILLQPPSEMLNSELWRLISEEGVMDFPVIVEIISSHRGNITICLHCDSLYVPSSDVETIAKDFVTLVNHTIRYPSAQAMDQTLIAVNIPSIARAAKEIRMNRSSLTNPKQSPDLVTRSLSKEEQHIRDILSRLSGHIGDAIKHDTTIFQLGLDSINAVQLSVILRKSGYDVPTADILETPSMSQIASLLTKPSPTSDMRSFDFSSFELKYRRLVCEDCGVSSEHVDSIRPCTPVQSGMLASFTKSEGNLYCNRIVLKSLAPLSWKLLRHAWSEIIAKYEMLRTGFVHLKDRQFPFAMITYRKNAAVMPWNESKRCSSKAEANRIRKNILDNLHLPPWSFVVRDLGSTTEIEFTALHAIYDARSLESILSDVAEAYRENQIPRPVSINSVIDHILTTAASDDLDLERFWKELGSGFQAIKFPDLTPVHVQKVELLVHTQVSTKPLELIDARCRELGISLQAVGQAAWARILSAYTGETNITFGVVFSGRDISGEAQEAGFPCLVTLPFQCCIKGSNRDLINSIMKTNAKLVKRQFTPLSKIQRWFNLDQSLFDTLFVYQKLPSVRKDSDFWEIVEDDARIDYPISIELIPSHGVLELRLTHRSDLVPQEQASLILDQFDNLLVECLFYPESSSTEQDGLQTSLLSIIPPRVSFIPSFVKLLHQFVEDGAQKLPERIAFEFASSITSQGIEKQTWTYRELNEIGNKVARLLQQLNTATGGLVAICFDKCPEASFAILGILKVGCAFVALDPSAPVARKQFIIQDSGSRVLLCTLDKADEFGSLSGVKVVALDELDLLANMASQPPILSRPISPSDICYCLYTSGTTGTPKGCEITHENAVQAMLSFRRLFEGHWTEKSRWLQFASFHFDVSVLEQYWSWSVGICVTSCPRDVLFQDLAGTIRQLQITHIDLTPSLARLVHPDEVPSLCEGVFITGGEQLKQEILDVWGAHKVIYNGYGPTEVTIGCTMLPRMTVRSKPSNIGPQFDNVGSYVFVPGTSKPVLRGGIGELCVSGALVGKGYLNRPDLTKDRFQFVEKFQERVYRTGDLVRILHDGSFQFLGRIDDQVKLRGQRLEIGEINAIIQNSTPELGEVATLVLKQSGQARQQLVSFITVKSIRRPRAPVEVILDKNSGEILSAIKISCQAKLPGYMVPTHIIPISSFPLSPNNKVEGKTLKMIFEQLSLEELQRLGSLSSETKSVSEENIRKIIAVLAEFSQTEPQKISPSSSIYELGLDSISTISFAKLLRNAGFQDARVSLIMKSSTVAGIAMSLRMSLGFSATSNRQYSDSKQKGIAFTRKYSLRVAEHLGLSTSKIEGIAPCTPLQEGMIFRFLESQVPRYCSSFRFELKPTTNLTLIRQAWLHTQRYVQLLRTKFVPLPDGYVQVVLKHDELPWFETTVSTEKEVESVSHECLKSWYEHINGFSGALWKIHIIKIQHRQIMCLNIFHALYDGNSLPLLLEQVALRYHDKEIPSHGPSFFDVLHMGPLRRFPEAEDFWVSHLGSLQVQKIFTRTGTEADQVISSLKIDGFDDLRGVKSLLRVTEHSIFHACWLLTLQHHFSVVPTIGIVVSGRALDISEVDGVIGPLFNTIPSCIKFQNMQTFADLVQACHEYYVSTLPFQHTALRDIMKWTGRTSENPLFEILFVFQKDDGKSCSLTEKIWTTLDSQADVDYPLSLEVLCNANNTLDLTIAARDIDISAGKAQALAFTFRDILLDMLQYPMNKLPTVPEELKPPGSNQHVIPSRKNSIHINGGEQRKEVSWTPDKSMIRDIIAELAGVEAETIHEETSIFELGLDSIDAIKLSSRLRNSGISLPVSIIMRCRTIQKMAKRFSAVSTANHGISTVSIDQYEKALTTSLKRTGRVPRDAIKILPTTPLQEAMIAEMVASDYQHYYSEDMLKLEPDVELQKVLDAWRTVINTHTILRTSFVEVEDPAIPITYAQIIHPPHTNDFAVIDVGEQPMEEFIRVQRYTNEEGNQVRPTLTIRAVRSGSQCFIILSIAHALYDGWSLDLLHRDVARCYNREQVGRPSYENALQQIIASSGDKAREFWHATLADFIPRQFPRGMGAGGDQTLVHRAERTLTLSHERIDSFCRHHGVTIQALTVTSWALVLAGFLQSLDVTFGLVLSGRNFIDADEIMFPTMNTVAFRTTLHGSLTDMLSYIQSSLSDIIEYQHFPLRKTGVGVRARALFDTLFIYQKRPTETNSQQKPLYQSIGGSSDTDYPISVEMELVNDTMICRIAGRDEILGYTDTTNLLDRINTVLSLLIEQPDHATVDFTNDGMRVCESPAFREETSQVTEFHDDIVDHREETRWSNLELRIRTALADISGIPDDQIHKHSTLFNLGLDSISAIKVSSLLRKQSIILPVSAMLKAGTIQKMAAAVEVDDSRFGNENAEVELTRLLNGVGHDSLLESYSIREQSVEKVFPTTSGQIYLLAMNMLNPALFYPSFFYATDHLRRSQIDTAWALMAHCLPVLRTIFIPTGQREMPFLQIVLRKIDNPVIWHRSRNGETWTNSTRDITSGPVSLHAKDTERGTMLRLQIHHALYDAVSLPKLTDMLARFCIGQKLEVSKVDLSEFVAFQSIHSPLAVRKRFWKNYLSQLGGKPRLDGRPTPNTVIQKYFRPRLFPNVSRVEAIARQHSLSIQALFLAIYARIHSRIIFKSYHKGQDYGESPTKVVVGVYLANRAHALEGLPELIGPTLNMVPLVIEKTTSIIQAAQKVQRDLYEISRVEHSGVSLVEIADWTGIRLDTFINFLRLPESEDMAKAGTNYSNCLIPLETELFDDHTTIKSDDANMGAKNRDIIAPIHNSSVLGSEYGISLLEDVYKSSIDVEAAVRDNGLDVGIFALEEHLDQAVAGSVLVEIQKELTKLVEDEGTS